MIKIEDVRNQMEKLDVFDANSIEIKKEQKYKFYIEYRRVIEKLLLNFPHHPHIKEKVHLLINMVDNLCHEIIYHQHPGYDYEYMQEETIKLIEYMLEDTYENW